jgi:hypothetical protein
MVLGIGHLRLVDPEIVESDSVLGTFTLEPISLAQGKH